jgi:hypothetical protein
MRMHAEQAHRAGFADVQVDRNHCCRRVPMARRCVQWLRSPSAGWGAGWATASSSPLSALRRAGDATRLASAGLDPA